MKTTIFCQHCQRQLVLPMKSRQLSVRCPSCKGHLGWTSPVLPPTVASSPPPDEKQITKYTEQLTLPKDGWAHIEGCAFLSIVLVGLVWFWSQASLEFIYVLMTCSSAYVIINYLLHPALAKMRTRKYEKLPCPHNIAGGFTGHHCETCTDYTRHQEALRLYDQQVLAWRDEIDRAARRLAAKEKQRLVKRIRRGYDLLKLSPRAFEDHISDLFRHMGYEVTQTPPTNDRGRDAIARRDGETYLIECKRWARKQSIGRRDLQVFHSAIIEEGAVGGFFVSTGRFGKTAREFVEGKGIELIDETGIVDLMKIHMPYNPDEADTYRAMCRECGSIVERHLSRPKQAIYCMRSHKVMPSMTEEDVWRAVKGQVRTGGRGRRWRYRR